jgi:hypothetical protein
MKRSTLLLLVAAVILGGLVYFLEIKGGKRRDEPDKKADTSTPAFTFKSEDIAALTITRSGQAISIENRDGKWVITQPINAPADQSAIDSIGRDLGSARIERTISPSADEIKSFGLAEPAVVIDIKLKSGEQQKVSLGSKDFSGLSVYTRIGDASDVALLPLSLLTSADKPVDDLRDRSVFSASQYDLGSLDLTNENGRIILTKQGADWSMKSPVEASADQEEVRSLITEITSAKVAEFIKKEGEDGGDSSKYGLDKPKITLKAQVQGTGERVLQIGSKAESDYYAKVSDRPEVFKVSGSVYDKLNVKPSALRDRQIVKFDKDSLTRIKVKNDNLTLVAENKDGKWTVKEPTDKKDKELQTYKVFNPLENNKATEVLDKPAGSVTAKLAKPAVQVELTDKDGKTTVLRISSAEGDDVYVQVEGRAVVYKVGKQILESLNFKTDDVIL